MIYIPVGLTGKGTGSPRQLTAHKDSSLTVLCRNPDGAWAADAAQPSEHGALRRLMDPILESRQKNPQDKLPGAANAKPCSKVDTS